MCCDGAVDKLVKLNVQPDLIIGDMDSISLKSKTNNENIIIYNPDQDCNDLFKSLEWCEENNYSDVFILGASGGREDHTLGNIFILFEFLNFSNLKLITDHGVFTLISKDTSFQSYPSQPVSIISIDEKIKIKTQNLNFPINDIPLAKIFSGTLNSSNSINFNVNISHGSVLVFQKHPKN